MFLQLGLYLYLLLFISFLDKIQLAFQCIISIHHSKVQVPILLCSTSQSFKAMTLITLQPWVLQSFLWELLLFGFSIFHNDFLIFFYKQNFLVPFYGLVYTATKLQSHYREIVYFELLSSLEFVVLIPSTWVDEGQFPPWSHVVVSSLEILDL